MKTVRILFMVVLFIVVGVAGALAASETKIIAPDAGASDYFGCSAAISGDYVIVGAHSESAGGDNAGAAYVFYRIGENTWNPGTKLVASDPQDYDHFGWSVSISGDYAIVGAYGEDTAASNAGAAYLYHRTGENTWDAGVKILASDAEIYDNFGYSVSISGDYAIVGADFEDGAGTEYGAAYIYRRTGTNTWDTGTKIAASTPGNEYHFGRAVAISGNYAVVGAPFETEGAAAAGAAYVFPRTGTNTWDTGTRIVAPDPQASDFFGEAVAIWGDYAIVGAPQEDGGAGDPIFNAGAAYIFHRTDTNTWDTGTKVVASDAEASDYFANAVSICDPYVIVGAHFEGSYAGAAYLYSRTDTNTWDTGTKITASDAAINDYYGESVAIYGYYAIVGALYEDPATVQDAGAAYAVKHDLPTAIDLLAFEAEWTKAGAVLSWITGSEAECGAFTILRCEIDELWSGDDPRCLPDAYRELDVVIPCADSFYGMEYEFLDTTVDSSIGYSYILREYETTGGVNDFGPILLNADKYGDDPPAVDGHSDDDGGADMDDDDDDDVDVSTDSAPASEDDGSACGV